MGAGSSKISGDEFLLTRTRDQLLQATSGSRQFMNSIFIYLKDELRLENYINLLGSEQQCDKFMFLLASQIDEVFERLPISVQEGKKDWILFQKTDALTTNPQTKQYSRSYCKYVAHFLVRLFQIYGALALSVLDNDAMRDMANDPELAKMIGQLPYGQVGIRRGLRPYSGQQGGDATTTNRILAKLKTIPISNLKVIENDANYNVKYGSISFSIDYYIKNGGFYVKIDKMGTSQGELDITSIKSGHSYHIKMIKPPPVYYLDDDAIKTLFPKIIEETIKLLTEFIKIVNQVEQLGNQEMYAFPRDRRQLVRPEYDLGERRPRFDIGGIGGPIGLKAGIGLTQTSSQPFAVLKTPPYPTPHCVTRALQLLSFSSGIKTPRTAICAKQFMKTSAGASNAGLKSFIDLFFDVTRKSTGSTPLDDARIAYQEMLKYFPNEKFSSIDDCGKNNKVMKIKPEATTEINKSIDAVKYMWKIQAEHTAKVAKFMEALFDIHRTQDGRREVRGINKALYEGGIKHLEEKLMPFARNMLIGYYSQCEQTYKDARSGLISKLQD
jgi:hypothetical protein